MKPSETEREARAREAVRRVIRNAPQLFSKEFGRKFYRAHMHARCDWHRSLRQNQNRWPSPRWGAT